jgi:hypothetical protein
MYSHASGEQKGTSRENHWSILDYRLEWGAHDRAAVAERLSSCHNFFTNFFPAATLLPSQRLPYTPQW